MKTLIIFLSLAFSLTAFSKPTPPTSKCEGTDENIAEAVARELEPYLVHNIRYVYSNADIRIKKEDVIDMGAFQSKDWIFIYHSVTNVEPHHFVTELPVYGIKFRGEDQVDGKLVCKWRVQTSDYVRMSLSDTRRSMGSITVGAVDVKVSP